MKKRTDKILLTVFVLTLIVYLLNFVICFSDLPLDAPPKQQFLILYFHSIPMFFLQLLLCRTSKLHWCLSLPLLLLLIPGLIFVRAAEWYMLAWLLFLFWCAAPATGCALAWAVYGFHQLYKRGDIRG